MKFTVDRDLMLAAVSKARSIINTCNTIPILGNIRIVAEDGKVAVRGSGLDSQVDIVMSADIEVPGATTIPCGPAYAVISAIPKKGAISFEINKGVNQLLVKSGRARLNLNTLPAIAYPAIDEGQFSHTFEIAKGELSAIFEGTQFAVCTEEKRYYMNGVYLHTMTNGHGPELRACATDGHRLALIVRDAPDGASGFPGVIVPAKTVTSALAMMDGDKIIVSISTSKIKFDFGSTVLISKLIDGTFPDYQRVIPNGNERTLRVDRDALIAAATRCAALGTERGHLVRLDISSDEGLTLSSICPDHGNAREEIDAEFESDAPLTIGFNARYLVSIAERFAVDTILMKFADPGSPTLLMASEGALDRTVLMPMRV